MIYCFVESRCSVLASSNSEANIRCDSIKRW